MEEKPEIWWHWSSKNLLAHGFLQQRATVREVLTADFWNFISRQGSEGDPTWQKVPPLKAQEDCDQDYSKLVSCASASRPTKSFLNFADFAQHCTVYNVFIVFSTNSHTFLQSIKGLIE